MRKPLAIMEKHNILFVTVLFLLQHHHAISAVPSVFENFTQTYTDCAAHTTNADCRNNGCVYDCLDNLCHPKQYECLARPSSPCFHLCGNPECKHANGCRKEDGFCLWYDDEKPSRDFLQSRANFATQTWSWLADCGKFCRPTFPFLRPWACLLSPPPTTEEMCARPEFKNDDCCQPGAPTPPPISSPPPPPPPPPATTQGPLTTPDPTEVTTTTEGPLPPAPPPDPIDLYCRSLLTVEACRNNSLCAYDCSLMICVKKERIREECSQGCYQYCHDPCGCKAAAGGTCEYSVVHGLCVPRPLHCTDQWFPENQCGRKDHFYMFGGLLCHNDVDRGDCQVVKNVLSVNANGRKHRDKRGIDHKADTEVAFEDPYNGRKKFYFSHSRLKDVDRYLFEGLVSAIGHGTDKRQCLRYTIPLKENGNYELTIKTYEPFTKRHKRRMFNIELNDVVVVQNLDIYGVVGKDEPMSIVVNFKVSTDPTDGSKLITPTGFAPTQFMDSVKLAFCVGDCRLDLDRFFWEIGNYVVSAFSVLKLA